ncbi:MAG: DIP1984 family protein [Helcococcus sp.]|nr:DIP1984 family protein [Helcococcus sp.]
MKLAEALQIKKNLDIKITNIKQRLENNARVQEGLEPAENPTALFKELEETIISLEKYTSRINITNSQTKVDGKTLTELLSRREALKEKIAAYDKFIVSGSVLTDRYSNTEILVRPTLPINEIQKRRDLIAKELREIDYKIQETNFTTDLI